MLTDGTQECPRCGARLKENDNREGFSRSDIAWFSGYTIAIVLIPIIISVAIGLICIWLFLG